MKKTFAVLMLAAMLFAVGCGNQAQEAAKDAQQKVEQTANEAKDKAAEMKDDATKKAEEMKSDAAAKVDEAKDAANKAAEDANAKVDEMKSEAADKMDAMKSDAEKMAGDMKNAVKEGRTIALNGIMPGESLDAIKAQFGEATSTAGDVMTFANGLKVKFDDATKKVKEISTTDNTFTTPEGMYVGANEYLLNEYCGPADEVEKDDDGEVEYKYFSSDKKSEVVYTSKNGIITEITCAVK